MAYTVSASYYTPAAQQYHQLQTDLTDSQPKALLFNGMNGPVPGAQRLVDLNRLATASPAMFPRAAAWSRATSSKDIKRLLVNNATTASGIYRNGYRDHFMITTPEAPHLQSQLLSLGQLLTDLGAHVTYKQNGEYIDSSVFAADMSLSVKRLNATGQQFGPSLHILSQFDEDTIAEEDQNTTCEKIMNQVDDNRAVFVTQSHMFEGNGNNLVNFNRNMILVGAGEKGEQGAHNLVANISGAQVFPVKMPEDSDYFHLDLLCCFLPSGHVMYCDEVLDQTGKQQLNQALFKGSKSIKEEFGIKVPRELASMFACNAVTVGMNDIVLAYPHAGVVPIEEAHRTEQRTVKPDVLARAQAAFQPLYDRLTGLGYRVHANLDLSLYNFHQGGFHCVINPVNQFLLTNSNQGSAATAAFDQLMR